MYSLAACWFRSTAVIMCVAVALNAALKSKLAYPGGRGLAY